MDFGKFLSSLAMFLNLEKFEDFWYLTGRGQQSIAVFYVNCCSCESSDILQHIEYNLHSQKAQVLSHCLPNHLKHTEF